MKKIYVLVIICVIFMSGCSNIFFETELDIASLDERACNHKLYFNDDFPYMRVPSNISRYIHENVYYRSESGDVWSDPQETFERGYGDCEDFAILFLNIYYINTGYKGDLVVLDIGEIRSVVDGGFYNHAVVRIHGRLFEPQGGCFIEANKIAYIYTFDEVFN